MDQDLLHIQTYNFLGGIIRVATWKSVEESSALKRTVLSKAFRLNDGEWKKAKPGVVSEVLIRLVYLRSTDTIAHAWGIISAYLVT